MAGSSRLRGERMTKPECRTAGYKLLGDYVSSQLISSMLNYGLWDMVGTSANEARSALQLSRRGGFISDEQLQTLEADLSLLESAAAKKDATPARQAFDTFFRNYGTVIIDAIAECERTKV